MWIHNPTEKWAINNEHAIAMAIMINTIKMYSLELLKHSRFGENNVDELAEWSKSTEPIFTFLPVLVSWIYFVLCKCLSN